MLKNEVWKTYPEFPWIQGSNFGKIRTVDRIVPDKRYDKRLIKGRILKQQFSKGGYMQVAFNANGKVVNRSVHRIIASCFIPNPDNLPQVNHKDCDRTNNNVDNLEWCTRKYNNRYRNKFGVSYKEAAPKSPVYAVNQKTQKILYFESQIEASRQLNVPNQNISNVINGQRSHTHNYWFVRANENAVEAVRYKFGNSMANKVSELLKDVETK